MNTETNTTNLSGTNTANAPALDREALLATGSSFAAYDAQLPIAERNGCRIVKCLYKKNTKTGEVAGENSYVYIPDTISDAVIRDRLDDLIPFFIGYLQEKEDSIVKELHRLGTVTVYPTNVGIDKVIELLETSNEGARLNKEKIEQWFDAEMLLPLCEAFAAKTGADADSDKILDIVSVYRSKLASLASPKVHFRREECEVLQKALETCKLSTSGLGARFYSRIERMKTSDSDLLTAL